MDEDPQGVEPEQAFNFVTFLRNIRRTPFTPQSAVPLGTNSNRVDEASFNDAPTLDDPTNRFSGGTEDDDRSEIGHDEQGRPVFTLTDTINNTDAYANADHDENAWQPTEEELLTIAFANDDNIEHEEGHSDVTLTQHAALVDHNRNSAQSTTPAIDDNTNGTDEEAGQRGTGERAESEEHEGDDGDSRPRSQNPWGMSDAELEQLRLDQERVWGFVRDRDSAPKPFECACGESSMEPYGFVNLTCADNCVRCVDCLNQNVRVGLESKKNYPPKCCIPIDFENVLDHLEPDLIDRWLDVRPEFEDVAPVYCSVKECSTYLPKSTFVEEGRWAACKDCVVKTCTACLCPESQHEADSDICPERLDQMDRDLFVKKGWKACPQCKEMIERTEGCDHMICECGHEFCYGCGRSYRPPFPCNCHGQNEWVEGNGNEIDQQGQLDLMNRVGGLRDEHDLVEEEDANDLEPI